MGITPTKVIEGEWWKKDPIEPVSLLRPQPERDVLLVVGDASGIWDDLAEFYDFGVEHDTMLINHIATVWPWSFEHFVAGDSHQEPMQAIAKELPKSVIKHCWNPNSEGFDVRWIRDTRRGWSGTTANLAIKIGIALDYLKIVLAGVPMDFSGHWYDEYLPENDMKRRSDHRNHLWKWTEIASRPVARFIRSMSGNTADLFGQPTKKWLVGG